MDPTKEQLDARLNPTPITFSVPTEGQIFRAKDSNDAVYKVVDGKLTQLFGNNIILNTDLRGPNGEILKAGSVAPTDHLYEAGYRPVDPTFAGVWGQRQYANQQYNQQNGNNAFDALPVFNIGDIVEDQSTGVIRKNTTVNDTPNTLGNNTGVLAPQVNLQPGQSGPDVLALQKYLVSQGVLSQADMDTGPGTYGPKTKAAVVALQLKLGVDAGANAGYYGPKTIQAISSGSTAAPKADGYYNINGAFYQKSGSAFTAVSDPATLQDLKSGKTGSTQTDFSSAFGSTIAGNITPEEDAFFNSDAFKNLPPDQQSAIHSIFNTVQTNDAQKKDLLSKALAEATKNADPIFKQTIQLSLDALDRGFQDNADDLQYKEKQLTDQLARLKEDTAYSKNDLSIEHANELQQFQDDLTQQLGDTRQQLASAGFTDSSRRGVAENILNKTKGNLVESSNRKFASDSRTLDNTLTRSDADTAAEIARLQEVTKSNNTELGRKTESIVGSANLPTRTGYDALGNVVGTAEQQRQADIDKAAMDYYNLGVVI